MAKAKAKNTQSIPSVRTPIVAVMGHVDHGKTSLLDAIRGTNVTEKEAGGITQNTRAHQIETKEGNKITFIDTPGHEAFSAMRSRGAEVTDFVLLVVAADDGIQAQTKQSIEFAHKSKVPIIVAINKIDIQGVNTAKIKQQLANHGVNIEEYGGDSMCFEVSATKGKGIDDLIEGIELLAQVNELRPHAPQMEQSAAQAYVLESLADKHIGPVALCILKAGELTERLFAVSGSSEPFRVRTYLDQNQKPIDTVQESDPFWITGLKKPLQTGDTVYFFEDERVAKELYPQISQREAAQVEAVEQQDANALLLQMLIKAQAKKEGTDAKVLNLIVKSGSAGTLEAVKAELSKLGDEEKEIRILEAAVGEITESDVKRAKLANGIVISFQLPTNTKIEKYAKQERVLIRNYEIIYEMLDELTGALDALIEPPEVEVEVARARIKQVFTLSDGEIVAGCEVVKGTMLKGYRVYIERPSESTKDEIAEIGRGKITSLRISKSEVKEVKKNQECGILIDPNPANVEVGDEIVAYKLES